MSKRGFGIIIACSLLLTACGEILGPDDLSRCEPLEIVSDTTTVKVPYEAKAYLCSYPGG